MTDAQRERVEYLRGMFTEEGGVVRLPDETDITIWSLIEIIDNLEKQILDERERFVELQIATCKGYEDTARVRDEKLQRTRAELTAALNRVSNYNTALECVFGDEYEAGGWVIRREEQPNFGMGWRLYNLENEKRYGWEPTALDAVDALANARGAYKEREDD